MIIQEVVEILAVDVKSDPPCFDEEDRMPRPEDILRLCGSLVSTNKTLDRRNNMDDGAEIRHFTAAHASVVDFLQTGRIQIGSETVASFTKAAANLEMAETCLVYLLHLIEKGNPQIEKDVPTYPFARPCAKMWHTFYRETLKGSGQQELGMDRLRNLVIRLLTNPESVYKWIKLCGLFPEDSSFLGIDLSMDSTSLWTSDRCRRSEGTMPALYCAATLGLPDIVDYLIKDGHHVDVGRAWDGRTPLIGACRHGREKVLSILLDNGANPNAPATCRMRPLAQAMRHKHARVFNFLLNAKGIDVNALKPHHPDEDQHDELCPGEHCQPFISAAAASGSLDFVKALMAAGADVNKHGGSSGTALEHACHQGRVDLVRCLLVGGANLNVQSYRLGGPLQAACMGQHIAIVKILLSAGADINRKSGRIGTALIEACRRGHADFVRILLDHGADPNVSWCPRDGNLNFDNALQHACVRNNHEIVSLLLDKGADPNIHGGEFGSPLHAAFYNGNNAIIDTLLQRGADSKYEGGLFRTVFKASIKSQKAAIIRRALELDLSANEKAGWLTCPLLPGNALKDSLELLSKEFSHQENDRVRKVEAKVFTTK